jgi:hypothetical protein
VTVWPRATRNASLSVTSASITYPSLPRITTAAWPACTSAAGSTLIPATRPRDAGREGHRLIELENVVPASYRQEDISIGNVLSFPDPHVGDEARRRNRVNHPASWLESTGDGDDMRALFFSSCDDRRTSVGWCGSTTPRSTTALGGNGEGHDDRHGKEQTDVHTGGNSPHNIAV